MAVSQSVNVDRIRDITEMDSNEEDNDSSPGQTKKLFKSLVSSQEFDIELKQTQVVKDLPTVYASQTLLAERGDKDKQLVSLSKVDSPSARSKLLLQNHVSESANLVHTSMAENLQISKAHGQINKR